MATVWKLSFLKNVSTLNFQYVLCMVLSLLLTVRGGGKIRGILLLTLREDLRKKI